MSDELPPRQLPQHSEPEASSLDALLTRTASPRRRVFRLLSALVLVAVAGVLLRQALGASGPPTTLPIAGSHVLTRIGGNITWGTITVAGHKLSGPPPQVVTLSGDDTVITLDAPPFSPLSCHVAALDATPGAGDPSGGPMVIVTKGPCGHGIPGALGTSGAPGQPQAEVDFNASDNGLPSDVKAAAERAITTGLAGMRQTATVLAGEYFAAGRAADGRVLNRRATTPLSATLDTVPSTPPDQAASSCSPNTCGYPFTPPVGAGGQVWSLFRNISLRWSFFDPTGTRVGDATFAYNTFQPLDTTLFQIYLAYDGVGGWREVGTDGPPDGNPDGPAVDVCTAGQSLLLGYLKSGGTLSSTGTGLPGCVVRFDAGSGAPAGIFLWRFGAVLAANTEAHKLLPSLPIAPPAELAEAMGHTSG